MLWAIVGFLVAIGILVTFHEWGHFLVARWCGVKVERFSIGFGRSIFSRTDRHGTEFVVGWLPLGGYVKMLDSESDESLSEEEKQAAFDHKSVWQRMAIVVAGPVFNFILAWFFYWVILMVGVTSPILRIGDVLPDTPAATSGVPEQWDIVSVDGQRVSTWQGVVMALLRHDTEQEGVQLQLADPNSKTKRMVSLPVQSVNLIDDTHDPLSIIGIEPLSPPLAAIVGQVMPGSLADRSGILIEDKLIRVNGELIKDFYHLLKEVKKGQLITLEVERESAAQPVIVSLMPEKDESGEFRLGIVSKPVVWPEEWVQTIRFSPFDAVLEAAKRTSLMIQTNFILIGKMVTGKLSLDGVSGPVGIAQVAGLSAQAGWLPFISLLAVLSIALGVLNLLPVPLLDGGALLFYTIEAVIRRPVPRRIQSIGFIFGATVLACLLVIGLINDVGRL